MIRSQLLYCLNLSNSKVKTRGENMQSSKVSTWNKMVHAPFKKVVKFDLICIGIGILIGMGIGAFIVANF